MSRIITPIKFESKIIQKMLSSYNIDKLDLLSEEWLNSSYKSNPFEEEQRWNYRKKMMIYLIINEKLNRYEQT